MRTRRIQALRIVVVILSLPLTYPIWTVAFVTNTEAFARIVKEGLETLLEVLWWATLSQKKKQYKKERTFERWVYVLVTHDSSLTRPNITFQAALEIYVTKREGNNHNEVLSSSCCPFSTPKLSISHIPLPDSLGISYSTLHISIDYRGNNEGVNERWNWTFYSLRYSVSTRQRSQ